jgi:hypothetical protein
MTVTQLAPRRCEGCGTGLPPRSRPNRRYCDAACKARAQRRRRRERAERQLAEDEEAAALREAVERATGEDRLLATLARSAHTGNVRACIYLLERLYPVADGIRVDERTQNDELAKLRALHRRIEAAQR